MYKLPFQALHIYAHEFKIPTVYCHLNETNRQDLLGVNGG